MPRFSLAELVVVVAIVCVFLALVAPGMRNAGEVEPLSGVGLGSRILFLLLGLSVFCIPTTIIGGLLGRLLNRTADGALYGMVVGLILVFLCAIQFPAIN